jgi:hypothetical protein
MNDNERRIAMAKPRVVLSDAELLEYSKEHVFYEIWMLVLSADLLGETVVTPSGLMRPPHWNAALESFVLHLRNLVDFLYPTNIKPTDVLADDFFPQRLRPNEFPTIPPLLAAARGRAHKQLSHLTTDRLPEGHSQKGWKRGELLLAIFPVLGAFARRLGFWEDGWIRYLFACLSLLGCTSFGPLRVSMISLNSLAFSLFIVSRTSSLAFSLLLLRLCLSFQGFSDCVVASCNVIPLHLLVGLASQAKVAIKLVVQPLTCGAGTSP